MKIYEESKQLLVSNDSISVAHVGNSGKIFLTSDGNFAFTGLGIYNSRKQIRAWSSINPTHAIGNLDNLCNVDALDDPL